MLKRADVVDQDLLIRFKNKNIWLTKHHSAGAQGSVGYWSILSFRFDQDNDEAEIAEPGSGTRI